MWFKYVKYIYTWINDSSFRVVCSRREEGTNDKFRVVRWEDDCLNVYNEVAINEWRKDLMRTEAKRGEGGNKLRTYAQFKYECGLEPYLISINSYERRVLVSKFRLGICPLRIESGRYEVVSRNSKGRPVEQRVCLQCMLGRVEDEFHFLLECPAYSNKRERLLCVIKGKFLIYN